MKKLFILFLLIISAFVFGQKRVYLYNTSSQDVYISYMVTTKNATATPDNPLEITSTNPSFTFAPSPVPYLMETTDIRYNQEHFPFESTNTSFSFTNWRYSGLGIVRSSDLVIEDYGKNYDFAFVKIVGTEEGSCGGSVGSPLRGGEDEIICDDIQFRYIENVTSTGVDYILYTNDI